MTKEDTKAHQNKKAETQFVQAVKEDNPFAVRDAMRNLTPRTLENVITKGLAKAASEITPSQIFKPFSAAKPHIMGTEHKKAADKAMNSLPKEFFASTQKPSSLPPLSGVSSVSSSASTSPALTPSSSMSSTSLPSVASSMRSTISASRPSSASSVSSPSSTPRLPTIKNNHKDAPGR